MRVTLEWSVQPQVFPITDTILEGNSIIRSIRIIDHRPHCIVHEFMRHLMDMPHYTVELT